eukprot:6191260-Pleurochrysis_carterae.AAC.1
MSLYCARQLEQSQKVAKVAKVEKGGKVSSTALGRKSTSADKRERRREDTWKLESATQRGERKQSVM